MNIRRIVAAAGIALAFSTGPTMLMMALTAQPSVAAPAWDPDDPDRTPGGPFGRERGERSERTVWGHVCNFGCSVGNTIAESVHEPGRKPLTSKQIEAHCGRACL
jgi:hypothetical protein